MKSPHIPRSGTVQACVDFIDFKQKNILIILYIYISCVYNILITYLKQIRHSATFPTSNETSSSARPSSMLSAVMFRNKMCFFLNDSLFGWAGIFDNKLCQACSRSSQVASPCSTSSHTLRSSSHVSRWPWPCTQESFRPPEIDPRLQAPPPFQYSVTKNSKKDIVRFNSRTSKKFLVKTWTSWPWANYGLSFDNIKPIIFSNRPKILKFLIQTLHYAAIPM